MKSIQLTEQEVLEVQQVLDHVMAQYESAEDEHFLIEAALFAQELPARLRKFLNDFKVSEMTAGCLITGYPIDDRQIGKTPQSWKERPIPSPTLREEMYFVMVGSLLGELFGWSTQQDGRVMHNLLPMQGYEHEQMGISSEGLLWWHTEEAFHPYRPDYLGLMCMRNPDHVATTYSSVEGIVLEPHDVDVLFENRFLIRPDHSHFQKNNSDATVDFTRIELMNNSPEPVAVLFGDKNAPYMRIDPFFMETIEGDEEAREALDALMKQIDQQLIDVALQPGDIFFVDNFRAVHGRKPFSARFDGNDRWLKRIVVARDLRKTREMRATVTSRVIL